MKESEKNKLIFEMEKSIISNFAKTFNSIKRADDVLVNEGLKDAIIGGTMALSSLAGINAQAQDNQAQHKLPIKDKSEELVDKYLEFEKISGIELGRKLIDLYTKNKELADKWGNKHAINLLVYNIKDIIERNKLNPEDEIENTTWLGNRFADKNFTFMFIEYINKNNI